MEKYSQFRDKGTAIAPFLPVPTPTSSALWTPVHILLFLVRLPAVTFLSLFYFTFLEFLPVGSFIKTCVLWLILAIPGVWWVDLQVDGVKRGYVTNIHSSLYGSTGARALAANFFAVSQSTKAEQRARDNRNLANAKDHLPYAGTVIASSFTSPLDPLYLAGIFSPVFTRSYPGYKKVEQISLLGAILLAFAPPKLEPNNPDKLVTLQELKKRNPGSIICVFPESTTTNGRGILPFSPSLLTADEKTKVFPVNLRYTPGDVTTPVPGNYFSWFWRLLSKPTHVMRVRIAMPHYMVAAPSDKWVDDVGNDMGYDTNIFDDLKLRNRTVEKDTRNGESEGVGEAERKVLDRVAEDLARLGRVKRVGLGVVDKIEFVKVWTSRRR
ncbi:hypothetical protein BU24DRAFT_415647 [Aaosphaeria arxii CBS 175.79]|uniref:Phospholipid/glycerol acyltransferase domain-containing protein n=1 Tax=Aaosphaeria arxii CBS 175.79 TaxID=1450172 RepID=A0A6A5X6H2_9PLEO|nr:uncharacterized protein BU24DRAFT_415647 [Aaosphaeria arxii CBS 175.79]KAF2008588.1 hypothetical protein BU24DRAFT_415647 [Aaosphaeria arxii CBS 175.79]